jgi:predicted lipoprotein with Yx(FWY)xxD motif
MTLYRLSGEHGGKFICVSSGCLAAWHPLTVSAGAKATGIVGLGTIKRSNGVTQVTYKGMPLYTFAEDHSAGQANGQGIKDVGTWNAVAAGPAKYSAPAPSSSGSSGAYGY